MMPFGASLYFKLEEVGQIIQGIPPPKAFVIWLCWITKQTWQSLLHKSLTDELRECSTRPALFALCTAPASQYKPGAQTLLLTVHLCGFSPVCLLMWTTSIYWALKGFCSREQSSHRHTNSFFSPCMWSLLICCSGRIEVTA